MVELKDENIIFSKYLDTDIDSICIHFSRTDESLLMDEYDVPNDYKYIVFVGNKEGKEEPDFIEVANFNELKKVIDDEKCLPEMRFNYKDDNNITLIDFFKKYVL